MTKFKVGDRVRMIFGARYYGLVIRCLLKDCSFCCEGQIYALLDRTDTYPHTECHYLETELEHAGRIDDTCPPPEPPKPKVKDLCALCEKTLVREGDITNPATDVGVLVEGKQKWVCLECNDRGRFETMREAYLKYRKSQGNDWRMPK